MASLSLDRREARLNADYEGAELLSDRTFNCLMIGVILYGLLVNVILCFGLHDVLYGMSEFTITVLFVLYGILGVIGVFITNSDSPVVSFIGYNMFVVPFGLVISAIVANSTDFEIAIIAQAFGYTAVITACMLVLGFLNCELFLSYGGILADVLIGLIVSGCLCWWLGWDTSWQSWLGAILFSVYIGYDFARSQQFERTADNAVDCAMDIYMDIVTLFVYLIRILGNGKRRR